MGETIRLKTEDGHELAAYRVAPAGKPRGALVVVQEIFGVNHHMRAVADGFAAAGYLCVAPAIFDRIERGVELGYGPDDIARGRELRGRIEWPATLADIAAAVPVAKAGGKVGVVGYCWGGSVAWRAATSVPGVAAAVCYYGGAIAPFRHEHAKCPVMMHFGTRDASIPMTDVAQIQEAQPKVEYHIYDAEHGFSCDERKSFDKAVHEQALARTLAFFATHLS